MSYGERSREVAWKGKQKVEGSGWKVCKNQKSFDHAGIFTSFLSRVNQEMKATFKMRRMRNSRSAIEDVSTGDQYGGRAELSP